MGTKSRPICRLQAADASRYVNEGWPSLTVATAEAPLRRANSGEETEEVVMGRGILVFLVILLMGGGVFWALVGGCVAS
jgi:hypothetical protein